MFSDLNLVHGPDCSTGSSRYLRGCAPTRMSPTGARRSARRRTCTPRTTSRATATTSQGACPPPTPLPRRFMYPRGRCPVPPSVLPYVLPPSRTPSLPHVLPPSCMRLRSARLSAEAVVRAVDRLDTKTRREHAKQQTTQQQAEFTGGGSFSKLHIVCGHCLKYVPRTAYHADPPPILVLCLGFYVRVV